MGEHREFIGTYEKMGEGVWSIDDQIADTSQEVVRCKDCVSCYRDEDGMWCCLYGTGFYRRPRYEADYCSKGKRRDA